MRRMFMLSVPQALNPYDAVVIRHSANLVDHAALDDHICFWPMDLKIARHNRGEKRPAFETTNVIDERDAIAGAHMQLRGILRAHQNGVARRAIQRIDVGIDQGVELFSPPRADMETAGRAAQLRQINRAKMSF